MSEIHILTVLSEIDFLNNSGKTFELTFIKKSTGEIRKGVFEKKGSKPRPKGMPAKYHSIKNNRVKLLYEPSINRHTEIKFDLVTHFNGIRVSHESI